MKRFVYAAAAIVLTGVLVLLAMAVAQRDARVSNESAVESQLPYANQPAKPIAGLSEDFSSGDEWPPAPLIRGNDSGLPTRFPSESAETSVAFASYTQGTANEPSENPVPSSQPRRLAEPPPLMNKFLTPSPNASSNSQNLRNQSGTTLPGTTLPGTTLPGTLPTTLPTTLPNLTSNPSNRLPNASSGNASSGTLPSMPHSISDNPGNLPSNPSPNFPTSGPFGDSPSGSVATLGSPSNALPRLPSGNEPLALPLSRRPRQPQTMAWVRQIQHYLLQLI